MPSCPIEIPSDTEMVQNSRGYPPAAWTPSLTSFASRSRERLQGVISFQLEATPICGLAKSSSPIPTARSIPREAVASRPSVTTRDRGLMSGWAFRPAWSECGPGVCGCAVMAVQSSAYRLTGLGCSHGAVLSDTPLQRVSTTSCQARPTTSTKPTTGPRLATTCCRSVKDRSRAPAYGSTDNGRQAQIQRTQNPPRYRAHLGTPALNTATAIGRIQT